MLIHAFEKDRHPVFEKRSKFFCWNRVFGTRATKRRKAATKSVAWWLSKNGFRAKDFRSSTKTLRKFRCFRDSDEFLGSFVAKQKQGFRRLLSWRFVDTFGNTKRRRFRTKRFLKIKIELNFKTKNRRKVTGKGKLNELNNSTEQFPYYYRDWSKLPDHCIFLKDEKLKTYIPWWGTKVLWLRQRTHIWVVVGLTGWFKQS